MAYAHARFIGLRQDGVPSLEQGSGGAPSGADPGTIGWNRPTGSTIICTDTGDQYSFDGTNWDQDLNVNSTFQDAGSPYDTDKQVVSNAAADSGTSVHASYTTGINVNFPGAFTNPDVPRNVRVDYSGGYDGGDTTITGTDINNAPMTEVIADVAGTSVYGVKCFKTVAAAAQQNLGGGGQTASIGCGHKFGIQNSPALSSGVCDVNGVTEPCVIDIAVGQVGFTPTTLPDGARDFTLTYPKTGQTSVVTATP